MSEDKGQSRSCAKNSDEDDIQEMRRNTQKGVEFETPEKIS